MQLLIFYHFCGRIISVFSSLSAETVFEQKYSIFFQQ
jgi:hypothetical protein